MYIVVTRKSLIRKIHCFSSEDTDFFWLMYEKMLDHIDLDKNNITIAHCSSEQLPDWVAANVKLTVWERLVAMFAKKIWIEEYRVGLNPELG